MRRIVVALGVGMVMVLAMVPCAGAHGDKALMAVEASPTGAPSTYRIEARMAYQSDGHRANGAATTATAMGPNGATVGPVPLEPAGDGLYAVELAFPGTGDWIVRVEATNPTATAQVNVAVGATPTTATTPTTAKPSTAKQEQANRTALLTTAALVLVFGGLGTWFARRTAKRMQAED